MPSRTTGVSHPIRDCRDSCGFVSGLLQSLPRESPERHYEVLSYGRPNLWAGGPLHCPARASAPTGVRHRHSRHIPHRTIQGRAAIPRGKVRQRHCFSDRFRRTGKTRRRLTGSSSFEFRLFDSRHFSGELRIRFQFPAAEPSRILRYWFHACFQS